MKFKVFDDFISPTYQNILQAIFLAENTKWSYQEHMNYGNSGLSQFYISIFDQRMIEHVELYHSLLGFCCRSTLATLHDEQFQHTYSSMQTWPLGQ